MMSVTEKIGLSTLTVQHTGRERDTDFKGAYRQAYEAVITTPQWQYVDNTLRSGVGAAVNENDMFSALLSFLTACAEGYPDGDSSNLFPKHVAEWANSHSYELENLQLTYDENADLGYN
jgi:hypothetical protein